MLDFSWSEILVIAVVALMVVRPKDLPQVLKVGAQFLRKARGMAREFQSGLEEMVREAELHEVKREIESAASTDISRELENTIDPGGGIARSLDAKSLDLQGEVAAGVEAPTLPPPESPLPAALTEAPPAEAIAVPHAEEPAPAIPPARS